MARVIYVGRDTKVMTPATWKEKSADAAYSVVREYDNGVVHIQLKWVGRVVNPTNTFSEYWPVFILLVKNYREDGSRSNDPVDDLKTFPDEKSAISAYEKFLLLWTECSVDDDGGFLEADNDLTPPPPPDLNKPSTESEELGEAGAW